MTDAEIYDALVACVRALEVHTFLPRDHETSLGRENCEICGANFRADCHLRVNEGSPADVRAEARELAWQAIKQIEADRRRRRAALDKLTRLTEQAGLYPWQQD